MDPINICRRCHNNVSPLDYFCPNCGKKLKEKPVPTTFLRQIGIYLISALLPPLGLWPSIKYLKQTDQKAKNIGIAALVLTILSTALTIYISVNLINSVSSEVNDQLKIYQDFRF